MLGEDRQVLLVEDDPDDRYLAELAWKQAGVPNPLRSVEDGRKAIEYLSGTGDFSDRARFPLPGVVLLDVKLPGLSGIEVLRWLRSREELRLLPVLMLSASTSPADVEAAYEAGANGFFIKPSSIEELTHMFSSLKGCWLRYNEFPRLGK